ncbi:unnamed protein product [Colias eurytheme]|nr:unnamed protein product [Colias eurytheme]
MDVKKHIFTCVEKKCFMELIKKYRRVIENEKSDAFSLSIKNEAWNKVAAEFNASPQVSIQATHKQLRRLWMNLRQRQREITRDRQQQQQQPLANEGEPSYDLLSDPDISMNNFETIQDTQECRVSEQQATEKHEIEMQILKDQLREDMAKVDPAGLILRHKQDLQDTQECKDSEQQATEKHEIEMQILKDQLREDMAKADPAGLILRHKQDLQDTQECKDSEQRANEKHEIEMQILKEQLREAKAKADLAVLILRHKQDLQDTNGWQSNLI